MKKILKSKIFAISLACMLLVGVFAGISILANNTPTLTISGVNLKHDGQVKLAFTIEVDNEKINESNLHLFLWGKGYPTGNALDTPDMTASVKYSDNNDGTFVAYSKGFAPAEMTQVVYAQVVYDDGEETIARSNIVRYSVFEHICRMSIDANSTADDLALYSAMYDYIDYAQKYLGWSTNSSVDDLAYIQVDNGYIEPKEQGGVAYTHGVYLGGDTITIVANCEDSEFAYWYRKDTDTWIGKTPSYTFGLVSGESRNYAAVSKSTVTVDTNADVGITVTCGNKSNTTDGKFTASGNVYTVEGRYLTVSAPASQGDYVLAGWYVGNKCVSTSSKYTFIPHLDSDGTEIGGQKFTVTAKYVDYEESHWNNLRTKYGVDEETITALQTLNDFYNGSNMINWMATLWDESVGGFYYSTSAAENVQFLPDLESTQQLTNFLSGNGATGDKDRNNFLPLEMKTKIINYVKSLQAPDGYFYHTQWPQGKENLQNDRFSRDLDWGTQLIRSLHIDTDGDGKVERDYPNYCTPNGEKCATNVKNNGVCSCSSAKSTVAAVSTGFSSVAQNAPESITVSLRGTKALAAKKVQTANIQAVASKTVSNEPDDSSAEAFVEWLYAYSGVTQNGTDLLVNSGKAHNLAALMSQIVAKGYGDETVAFLDEMQARAWNYMVSQGEIPTGIWQTNLDHYSAVWGVLKYMPYYNNKTTGVGKNVGDNSKITIDRNKPIGITIDGVDLTKITVKVDGRDEPIPDSLIVSLTMINSCLKIVELAPELCTNWHLNDMMNQWNGMQGVIDNIYKYHEGSNALKAAYRDLAYSLVRDNLLDRIENSIKKLEPYEIKVDGVGTGMFGYSYGGYSPKKIYGTPISLGVIESDVNGTSLVCTMYRSIFTTVGVPSVPLCNANDGKRFLEMIGAIEDAHTFTESDLGTVPSGITSYHNPITEGYYFLGTVEDPAPAENSVAESNPVLYFKSGETTTGSNEYVTFNVTGKSSANSFVFETKLKFNDTGSSERGKDIFQISIGSAYMLTIGYDASYFYAGYRTGTGTDATAKNDVVKVSGATSWHTLRLEMYNDSGTLRVKYFIDGQYVDTDSGHHYNSHSGKALNMSITTVKFTSRMHYKTELYFDNCYFNKENLTYSSTSHEIIDARKFIPELKSEKAK